ncbi:polysaccharide biosynthesis C-terminal domain-containing protein [Aerococcus urinaeequi]|uniref:Polysaccharide biosynthesis C-terminal domain-containing protein n=1 Tax=Aerococcus urinaeequi TaxID=51665 RepID=A0AA47GAR1_9LACT|nr:polysaccharide biosynthesis C-terminal domain-containing protein [Aerococcus urinaeequi]WAT25500.1 polysaccharide biosynthesis C-terminal domain-containing protein [Aerococcus urinaeequi]
MLSGFIFFGRPFIGIWAGENYYEAYPIALILMATITIPLIQNVGIEIQRAKNMHQFRSWTYLFMAIGNILITIPLIQRFGGFGAAIGTSLSYLIGNGVLMNLYNHFKIGLNMNYFWKEIAHFIPAFIVPTLYGLLINNLVDLYNIGNLLIYGIIYVALFAISMWLVGLNEYEKNLVRTSIK